MTDEKPLDTAWLKYHDGFIKREALETAVFIHIRDNPRRFALKDWSEDERLEFLSWFYPYLRNAIDRYRQIGSTFDAYIHELIRYRSIIYRVAEAERNAMETCYWRTQTIEAVHDEEAEYESGDGSDRHFPFPNRILMLALKCCYYVSDDFIAVMAESLKLPAYELRRLFDELRKNQTTRFSHLEALERSLVRQNFLCLGLEERISIAPVGSSHHRLLEQSLERARRHLGVIRNEYRRMPKSATNKEVANILGLPKGTVDSGLAAVKQAGWGAVESVAGRLHSGSC